MNIIYVGLILFFIGGVGFLSKKNIFTSFICLELMLNAINLMLASVAFLTQDISTASLVLLVLALSAAEAALALAIIIIAYRDKSLLNIDLFSKLRG